MHADLHSVHRCRRTYGSGAVPRRVVAAVLVATMLPATIARALPDQAPRRPLPGQGPAALSTSVSEGSRPTVSGDGRYVVFQGRAEDGRATVYRTDRSTADTIELSRVPAGVRGGDTVNPVISADGCVVVAHSQVALDVFRDDDRGRRWDVYRLVVPECGGVLDAWELVSTIPGGSTARDDVAVDAPATVSGSGAVVAYTHPYPAAPDGVSTIGVVDLTLPIGDPGRITTVAGMPAEAPNGLFRYRGARQPALSANGRHLAFVSDATSSEPLPGWGEGPVPGQWATSQVYVWDRGDTDRFTAVQLVSAAGGAPSGAGGEDPAISEDGRVVVFVSGDQALAPAVYPRCDPTCPTQVYRYDRDTDGNGVFDEATDLAPVSIVSARPVDPTAPTLKTAGNRASWSPALNVDGSEVVFVTAADNLVVGEVPRGGTDADGDVVVAEVLRGSLQRATARLTEQPVPGAHDHPALSDTGRVLVFDTLVAAAITGDPLEGRHVVSSSTAPVLSLAGADFGSVLVGWESAELYVSVLNDGPGAFAPRTVVSSSDTFTVNPGGTCTAGAIVPAGGSCTVFLVFRPTSAAVFTSAITVAEDGFEAVRASTQVRGTGGEPMLQLDPPGLDLGAGVVGLAGGTAARRTIDVGNVSAVPTTIESIQVAGDHPGDFAVVGESCSNRALNPGASCSVEIELTPSGAGRRSALLVVTSATGAYSTSILSGEGVFRPSLGTTVPTVAAGGTLGLGGSGYPANATLVVRFGDGAPFALVPTNESGEFLAEVVVPMRQRAGERLLVVASVDDAATASVPVTVSRTDRVVPGTPGYGLG